MTDKKKNGKINSFSEFDLESKIKKGTTSNQIKSEELSKTGGFDMKNPMSNPSQLHRGTSKQPKQSQLVTNNKADINLDNNGSPSARPLQSPLGLSNDIPLSSSLTQTSRLPLTTKNKPVKLVDINKTSDIRESVKSPKRSYNQNYSTSVLEARQRQSIPSSKPNNKSPTRPIRDDPNFKDKDFIPNDDNSNKAKPAISSASSQRQTYSQIHIEKLNSKMNNKFCGSINTNSKADQEKSFPKSIYSAKHNTVGFKNFNIDSYDKQRSNSVRQGDKLDIMSLLNSNHPPLNLNVLSSNFPFYENSKSSFKNCNSIVAYAANTHQGSVRTYNEDRVSIILNIMKPPTFKGSYWPKCSFFAVYDGHGGAACADYFRDNLHQFIIKDSNFPLNPKEAIIQGCAHAEDEFINKHALSCSGTEIVNRSGSCAVLALIVDDTCFVGNVGDSRAVLSKNQGKEVIAATRDHKPCDENESKRIYSNGGRVYQTQTSAVNFTALASNFSNINMFKNKNMLNPVLTGPSRVFPGRLSVSRSFGDVEAKIQRFGGLENVLIATPEITIFKINEETDFLFLGCDGIFDLFKNEELVKGIFMTFPDFDRGGFPSIINPGTPKDKDTNIHHQCGKSVDMIMKSALSRNCLDNITSVLIAFSGLELKFQQSLQAANQLKGFPHNITPSTQSETSNFYGSKTARNASDFAILESTKQTPSDTDPFKNIADKKWNKEKASIVPPISNKFRQTNIEKAYKSIYTSSAFPDTSKMNMSASTSTVSNFKKY